MVINALSYKMSQHWNGNVDILTKFSPLAAPEVAKMTTSSRVDLRRVHLRVPDLQIYTDSEICISL